MKLTELKNPSETELKKLGDEFIKEFGGEKGTKEWGDTLERLSKENGMCSAISSTFIDWLKDKNISAKFISGETAINRAWNDIPKDQDEDDGHTAVQVGMLVIDFTARQFNKSFPFPRITEVGDFDEEWEKVSN